MVRRRSPFDHHSTSRPLTTHLSLPLPPAPQQPCTYSFPYNSVASFLGLSSAIENVGVAAYLGAANKITDPEYVTVAGSILTVEARHQAWMNSAVLKGSAWNGPEDTPLSSFSDVYTIAAAFITGCPKTNPALPVTAFPPASIQAPAYKAGDTVKLLFKTTGKTEYRQSFPPPTPLICSSTYTSPYLLLSRDLLWPLVDGQLHQRRRDRDPPLQPLWSRHGLRCHHHLE